MQKLARRTAPTFSFRTNRLHGKSRILRETRIQHLRTISWTDAGKTDAGKRAADRSFGYGNRAMLVAFPYNVPSQTLTCIWKQGVVNGAEWFPLIARRKKT